MAVVAEAVRLQKCGYTVMGVQPSGAAVQGPENLVEVCSKPY